MSELDQKDEIIVTSVILNCSKEKAFNYFEKNDQLSNWLTNEAEVEMKIGGKYELFWTPDDPDLTNNSTYGCKVLAVDKPNFFNIEWKGNAEQKRFMNSIRPLTNVTVIFTTINLNITKVTLIHTGWRKGDDWESARAYFSHAWSGALRKLETLVNGK
ncbi:SRPBCC domain-containing protein [Winogradskyella sp.]|uniref:SRPBCC family protein n=1 Tax=Winogradskyella sp. TaxID=1883156 RepID=UPI00261BD109|nr:SRPBCC domain-containing protein [Winogradskyella sp.]